MGIVQAIAIGAGTVAALVPVYMGVLEYRLKATSQRAEIDTRLARLFAELVPIADGRAEALAPEALVAHVLRNAADPHDTAALETEIRQLQMSVPVGRSTQIAAVSSIGELGRTYEILREPARSVLDSFSWFEDAQMRAARDAALARLPDAS